MLLTLRKSLNPRGNLSDTLKRMPLYAVRRWDLLSLLALFACEPAQQHLASVRLVIEKPARKAGQLQSGLSSADGSTQYELSADSCYFIHVTGSDHPSLRRLTTSEAECANGPSGLGMVAGLYNKGEKAELEVPTGPRRRFDLLALPKSALPDGVCSKTFSVDPSLEGDGKVQMKIGPQNFDFDVDKLTRLVATGSGEIKAGDNVITLKMAGQDATGVPYTCSDPDPEPSPSPTPSASPVPSPSASPSPTFSPSPWPTPSALPSANPISYTVDTTSLEPITKSNVTNYFFGGTCSPNDTIILWAFSAGGPSGTAGCSGGTWGVGLPDMSVLPEGTITLTLTTEDNATQTRDLTKDTTPPTSSGVQIQGGALSTNLMSVTLTLSSTAATHVYVTNSPGCVSGGTWQSITPSTSWTLGQSNAVATVYAKFKDEYQNETTCTSDSIIHDNTPPSVSVAAGGPIDAANQLSTFVSGTCSENTSPVNLSGTSAGVSRSLGTTTCSVSVWSTTINSSTLPNGTLTLTASQTDAAGNQGQGSANSSKNVELRVLPTYTSGEHWGQYVAKSGAQPWGGTDTACISTTPGGYSSCRHGGELRKVVVEGQTDCDNVTLSETLGLFNWVCEESANRVTFYTTGLRSGAQLSDLINFAGPSWQSNVVSVTVQDTPSNWVLSSNAGVPWWPTTISTYTSVAGGSINSGVPMIYVVTNDLSLTGGIILNSDSLSFVVKPGEVLSLNAASMTGVTVTATTKYAWIEGNFNCANKANSYGVLTNTGSNFARVDHVQASNCTNAGVKIQGNNSYVRDLLVANSAVGLGFYNSSWGSAEEIRAVSCTTAGVHIQSTNSFVRDLVAANSAVGLMFLNSSGSKANEIRIFNSTSTSYGALHVEDSMNTVLTQVLSTANAGDGIVIRSSSPSHNNNRIVGFTSTHNNYDGVFVVDSAARQTDNILHNGVSAGNDQGFAFNYAGGITAGQVVATNNQTYGIRLASSSTNKFTGNLLAGTNNNDNCYVSGGSDGLTGSCGTNGPSDATLKTSVNLDQSFFGKVTTDDSFNQSDTSGISAGQGFWTSNPLDGTRFNNPWRSWGILGASYIAPAPEIKGACTAGPCQIWDWTLPTGVNNAIKQRTGNATSSNDSFLSGNDCPEEVDGDVKTMALNGSEYLTNAIEILNDGRGNDDGLCEDNEACLYTPNFGAYQGYGSLGSCTFDSAGGLSGITIRGYNSN